MTNNPSDHDKTRSLAPVPAGAELELIPREIDVLGQALVANEEGKVATINMLKTVFVPDRHTALKVDKETGSSGIDYFLQACQGVGIGVEDQEVKDTLKSIAQEVLDKEVNPWKSVFKGAKEIFILAGEPEGEVVQKFATEASKRLHETRLALEGYQAGSVKKSYRPMVVDGRSLGGTSHLPNAEYPLVPISILEAVGNQSLPPVEDVINSAEVAFALYASETNDELRNDFRNIASDFSEHLYKNADAYAEPGVISQEDIKTRTASIIRSMALEDAARGSEIEINYAKKRLALIGERLPVEEKTGSVTKKSEIKKALELAESPHGFADSFDMLFEPTTDITDDGSEVKYTLRKGVPENILSTLWMSYYNAGYYILFLDHDGRNEKARGKNISSLEVAFAAIALSKEVKTGKLPITRPFDYTPPETEQLARGTKIINPSVVTMPSLTPELAKELVHYPQELVRAAEGRLKQDWHWLDYEASKGKFARNALEAAFLYQAAGILPEPSLITGAMQRLYKEIANPGVYGDYEQTKKENDRDNAVEALRQLMKLWQTITAKSLGTTAMAELDTSEGIDND